MIPSLSAGWTRLIGALGRLSMYRLVLLALSALAVIALVLSFTGAVSVAPLDLVVSFAVLAASIFHFGKHSIAEAHAALRAAGLPARG